MAIFGWLVLLLITVLITIWVGMALVGSKLWSGKVDKPLYLLLLIPVAFWWLTLSSVPFTIIVGGV
jgi:hypothetical protein